MFRTYIERVQQTVAFNSGGESDWSSSKRKGMRWENWDYIALNSCLKLLITPITKIAASL